MSKMTGKNEDLTPHNEGAVYKVYFIESLAGIKWKKKLRNTSNL